MTGENSYHMQTTMRVNLIVLLLATSCRVVSQEARLEGCYESTGTGYNTFGKDYFCFEGSSFQLLRITDTEDEFGIGHFTMGNDSINLKFDDYTTESNFEIDKLSKVDSDSIFLEIQIVDKRTGMVMPGASVLLMSNQKGAAANESGIAEIRILKNKMPVNDTLRVFFIGYSHQYIPINVESSNNQKLKVKLTSGYRYLGNDDFLQYRIIPGKNGFTLLIADKQVPYRRTTKSKYDKALKAFKSLASTEKK